VRIGAGRRRPRLLHLERLRHRIGQRRVQLGRDASRLDLLEPLPRLILASDTYGRQPVSGSQRVGTVTLSSITVDAAHSTCSTTVSGSNPDFTMATVPVNHVYGPGNGQSVTPTGTLTMNETGANQDACQGATLTLHLTNN
jgi:hypothetical protein